MRLTATKERLVLLMCLALVVALATPVLADTVVSTGYNDDPNENPLPSPWVASPNTIVVGNLTQTTGAASFDPDMNAVLFHNVGGSAISVSGVTFSGGWDLFAIAGQGSAVTVNPGWNLIVLGIDGSDLIGSLQTVCFTIDGSSHCAQDAVTADAGVGVLHGKVNWSQAETEPWAQIWTDKAPAGAVPEPASMILVGSGVVSAIVRKRRKAA